MDAAAALHLYFEQGHGILHPGDFQAFALERALLDLGAGVIRLILEVRRTAIDRDGKQPRRRAAAPHFGLKIAGKVSACLDDQRSKILLEEPTGGTLSPSFTASALLQICFHSPGPIVLRPPSVTILLSGATISLGQERRKAASASSCLSSVQPATSLKEIGAIPTGL